MSLGVLGSLGTYVVIKHVKRGHKVILLLLLTHINEYNMFLGVLGPLETYVVMKRVKRGHNLYYNPFGLI